MNNNIQVSQNGVYTPEPRVYELGYLIIPSIDEGNLMNERDALVALITQYKGIVISEGEPQLIDLAYDMTKMIDNKKHSYSQSYFGWIKFDISSENIISFTTDIESIKSLIRSIIIKTVKENTLISDQPFKHARTNISNTEQYEDDFSTEKLVDESKEEMKTTEETKDSQPLSSISDDLTKIEGIDPKIAGLLNTKDIYTYRDLSSSRVGDLREILEKNDLSSHDPKTWLKQATLAKNAKWEKLSDFQDEIISIKKV